jgi:hypothetical protein
MPVPDFSPGEVLTAAAMDSIGLWKVGEFTASGTSRALVCDNIFTDDYDSYRVVFNLNATSNTNVCFFQWINSAGSTVTAGTYYSTLYGQDYAGAGTGFTTSLSTTSVPVGWLGLASGTIDLTTAMDIYNTRSSTRSVGANGLHTGISAGFSFLGGAFFTNLHASAAVMRGIRFDNTAGTNLTGKVRVYGYRN